MPITKRPCANCPFRSDGGAVQLHPERLDDIVNGLLADDHKTFICHKTLDLERMTCAGAVGVMAKLGHLPLVARLGLEFGVISRDDIAASAALVIEPQDLKIQPRDMRVRPNKRSRAGKLQPTVGSDEAQQTESDPW
ncbi:DUF6283 family protein [Acidovorax sp.]|uniref:DUF6283 family protein n=1 Tax=Acidovorax sp. TaxID=1872122 RepID=UPI00391F7260